MTTAVSTSYAQYPVHMGKSRMPYPMLHRDVHTGEFAAEIGVIENDDAPLEVFSSLSPQRVLGKMYRDMPTPSLLNRMKEGLELRGPGSLRKLQYLLGSAGAGKSYLGELLGGVRDERGPIIVDCGSGQYKRNLSALLYQTVMDTGGAKNLLDIIDQRIANNTLHGFLRRARNARQGFFPPGRAGGRRLEKSCYRKGARAEKRS